MNKRILHFVLGLAMVMMPASVHTRLSAQSYIPTPVTISKEKVKVDGVVCYSHIVLERQTLYSISKAYNVSIDDLYRFNPGLKEEGLKKNGILIIPSAEAANDTPAHKKQEAKRQETLKETQKEAQKEAQKEESKKSGAGKDDSRVHVVKWFEDIDMIAEKYGVSVESIMAANGLKDRKLKSRQKITVPELGQEQEVAEQTMPETPEQTDSVRQEALFPAARQQELPIASKNEISAALLLPLKATGTSGNRSAMDFYSGVLIAVRDAADRGISTDLSVIDISEGILPSPEFMKDHDVVIGPISPANLRVALSASPASTIFVSPLDPRADNLAEEYPNLIQAPTSHKRQYTDLVKWILDDKGEKDNIIYISEKGARSSEALNCMKAEMDSSKTEYSSFSYSILEGREVLEPLSGLLTAEGTNRVLVASESEAFVNDVVRNLNLLIYDKHDIVLYGPSKIRNFETIDVESFHNAGLHVSLAYNIDYDDTQVRAFLMKYRALFNTEPSQFAFQGYDTASHFIDLINRFGDRWAEHIEDYDSNRLQSTFSLRKNAGKGYSNNGIRRIVYDSGWKVRRVE